MIDETKAGNDSQEVPELYGQLNDSEVQKPQTCRERYDAKLWSSGPLTLQEKSMNYLRAASYVSDKTLFIVRLTLWTLQTAGFIFDAIDW